MKKFITNALIITLACAGTWCLISDDPECKMTQEAFLAVKLIGGAAAAAAWVLYQATKSQRA